MDIFDKNYFMINYIFYKYNNYPFNNINILQFIFLKPLIKIKEIIDKLSKKFVIIDSLFIKDRKTIAI